MTHGISTEDISGLAMIWTDDDEDNQLQQNWQHPYTIMPHDATFNNTYKTIWSCGTEKVQ